MTGWRVSTWEGGEVVTAAPGLRLRLLGPNNANHPSDTDSQWRVITTTRVAEPAARIEDAPAVQPSPRRGIALGGVTP